MKNILLAINPDKPGIPCLQFGCYLAQLTESKLTAVFLENHKAGAAPKLKTPYGIPYVETILESDLPGYAEHEEIRSIYIETFKKICEDRGVRYSIHQDLSSPLEGLISETRFADLLILSRDINLEDQSGDHVSAFAKSIFTRSECPVMVSPITFDRVDEILFAYDNSRSSAFAIKQFCYLFPELGDIKVTMLHVQKKAGDDDIQREKLAQWISANYSYSVFKIMAGDPGSELNKFLIDKKRTMVVMGSYGRDALSALLHPSTAARLIENLDLPFFFAHN